MSSRAAADEDAAKPSPGRSPKRSAPHEEPAEEPPVGLFDPLIVAPITGVNALNKVTALLIICVACCGAVPPASNDSKQDPERCTPCLREICGKTVKS